MCDGDYCVTYPDSISLNLKDGKLYYQVGSGSQQSLSGSDIDTTISGASGITYQLKGLNLIAADAGSNETPIFPSDVTCAATVPPGSGPSVVSQIPAYLMISIIFIVIAGIFFLIIYNGSNPRLLTAKSWITGKGGK